MKSLTEYFGLVLLYAIIGALFIAVVAEDVSRKLRSMSLYTLMYTAVISLALYLLLSLQIAYTSNRVLIQRNVQLEIQNDLLLGISAEVMENREKPEPCAPDEETVEEDDEAVIFGTKIMNDTRLKTFLFPLLDRAADLFLAKSLKVKLIACAVLLVLVFLIGSWALGLVDNFIWYFKEKNFEAQIERDKREVQVVGAEIEEQKVVIGDLKLEHAAKTAEVKILRENHQESIKKTDSGRAETKKSLEKVRRIETRDYTNTPLKDAERSRCLAFPQSQGC